MAKMFNIHVDVYLMLKMFDFYFFKSKSRLLLFEQKYWNRKKKLLRITEKLFSLHVQNVL